MADKFSGRWKLRSPRRKKTTEVKSDKFKGAVTESAASSGLASEEPSPSPSSVEVVHTATGSSAPEIPPNGTGTCTRANAGRWKERGRVRGARQYIETLTASGGDNDEGTMSPLLPRRPELPRDPHESELFNRVPSHSEGTTTSARNYSAPHYSQSRHQGTSPSRPSNNDPGIQDELEMEDTLAPHQCPSGVVEGVEVDDATASCCCRRATQQANGTLQHVTGGQQRPIRILSIGIYLNGIAAVLASFAVVAGAESKALVKAVLSESNVTIVPTKRYTSRGSVISVHMSVDHKNRVFACVATVDVPLTVAFGLLDEVKIDYMLTASGLAFSTAENCHDKMCHAWIAKLWDNYERLAESLAQELKTLPRQHVDGLLTNDALHAREEAPMHACVPSAPACITLFRGLGLKTRSSHIGEASIDAAAWSNGETRKIDRRTPQEVIRLDFRFSHERAVVAAAREFLPGVPRIGIIGSTASGGERRTGFRVILALVLTMGAASLVVMLLYRQLTVFL